MLEKDNSPKWLAEMRKFALPKYSPLYPFLKRMTAPPRPQPCARHIKSLFHASPSLRFKLVNSESFANKAFVFIQQREKLSSSRLGSGANLVKRFPAWQRACLHNTLSLTLLQMVEKLRSRCRTRIRIWPDLGTLILSTAVASKQASKLVTSRDPNFLCNGFCSRHMKAYIPLFSSVQVAAC